MDSYEWRNISESQLVDCVTLPQWCKQSGGVFSKEVHMEGDSLCLPAAVALLRVWLNGSEAICSGPRYREQNSTSPISVMSFWIWLYTVTTNTLSCRRWLEQARRTIANLQITYMIMWTNFKSQSLSWNILTGWVANDPGGNQMAHTGHVSCGCARIIFTVQFWSGIIAIVPVYGLRTDATVL